MKHTKGPWDVRYFTRGKMKYADISTDAGGGCTFPIAKDVPFNESHIISAAPEMLEALLAIKETCPADADSTNAFYKAWLKLELAIEKAKGIS